MSTHRLLLLSVIIPSIEYGNEVWEGNKSQAGSLESIILDGAKRILGCSSKTCNEAVRGDMGLDTLQSRRDRAKLKSWYKLATLPEDRYPKQLFNQEWNIKPRRGRQRKVWSRIVDDLFKSLDINSIYVMLEIDFYLSLGRVYMHGLNEELGSNRGREGKTECSLCGDECENVSHVLWECSAYSSTRACFIKKLQELL